MSLKNTLRLIRKLNQKKYRRETGLFVAEGKKIIKELIKSDFQIQTLIATKDALSSISLPDNIEVITTDQETINRASLLKNPQPIIAIVKQRQWQKIDFSHGLFLALDNIQDPGNMGTIVRLADWFGIDAIIASDDCVDIYNPKVVQSSMGSIFRVPIYYTDLERTLNNTQLNIYGTFLDGQPINSHNLSPNAIIVMGNEAHGIRPDIEKYVHHRLLIPSFRQGDHAESLNVATATAIVLWEFRRRK